MIPGGLRTNIAVNLAIVLVLGMVLIDMVMLSATQQLLLHEALSKADLLLTALSADAAAGDSRSPREGRDTREDIRELLEQSGFACLAIVRKDTASAVYGSADRESLKLLQTEAALSGRSGEARKRFCGQTWGVFWKDHEQLILARPLRNRQAEITGGMGVLLDLKGHYRMLRRTQRLAFIYLAANTLVLTLVGLYLLSRITINPLRRLVRRSEDYHEQDEFLFASEKGDNEFGRLSRALNTMLRRIVDGKRELRATVRSLERTNAELKSAQNDVVRAEKLASVGRLSSGIAHEIGNPISVVTGYLALLKQDDLDADERSEYIRRAEEELERINVIIRQLLDISRTNAGGDKTAAVHAVIRDLQAVQTCQPMLADLEITFDLRAENDTVRADADQLRQVFLNLLINAADAIAAGDGRRAGTVAISSRTAPSQQASAGNPPGLEIVFRDNGAGIPAEHLANIFDPFFTTKEPGKGTGLGLAVSFMLIEHMGGTIRAASDAGGTAMTIWLPLADQTAGRSGSKETARR